MSCVYFLRPVGQDGPVKIGYSVMTEARIKPYFFWSPIPLELVAKIDALPETERQFHALFLKDHSHHEWFRASPELTATIEAIRAGTFDLSTLPPPVRLKTNNGARGNPDARRSASLRLRLNAAERHGALIPPEVQEAAVRYSNNPYHVGWGLMRDPKDAEIVAAYLDHLPTPSDTQRSAA